MTTPQPNPTRCPNCEKLWDTVAEKAAQPNPTDDLGRAHRQLLANRTTSYKRENGELASVEAGGEAAWIVDHETMDDLDAAILAALRPAGVGEAVKGDAITGLHEGIKSLRSHVEAIQAAKSRSDAGEAVSSAPILACVNDLPAIIRQLDVAELEIEAEFERYEDATPPHPDAALMERVRTGLQRARDDMKGWGAYADEYFRKKHNLAGDLAVIDALLSDLKAGAGR